MDKFDALFEFDKRIFSVYGKLLSVKRIVKLLKHKPDLNKNKMMKDRRRSDRCFVLGLGPSLKEIDLCKLDGDIIVTNRFFMVDGADKVNPVAYVIVDGGFYDKKNCDDLNAAVKMFPKSCFVLNGLYSDRIDKDILSNTIVYNIYLWAGSIDGKRTKLDCRKVMPIAGNVICAAEYIALYMGYREIFLLGCDFNSFASQKANHVYKEEDTNRLWSISTELFQYSFTADQHCQLDIYAKKHNQRILNLTQGSLIDAYEKLSCDKYIK